ncbi:MAG: ATP-dependent helicase [Gemmatimonadaceae bacterium]
MSTALNSAQREAVLHFEGPLLILAGAGSGKTRVLTSRIARLIEHHGVDPAHILAVTFTNKAAGEMRDRIARILGEQPAGMWAGTFHAIGARILRGAAAEAGRTSRFTIYDEDDSLGMVKRIMDRRRISARDWTPKAIRREISNAKNALVSAEEYASLAREPLPRAVATVYGDLEPAMRQANAVDFDDLLVLPVRILQRNAELLEAYRDRFRFVLVDEYQDTNRAQYQLVRLLGSDHGNVCVVGDDDQSIYGWRGADVRNILDFEKDFPSAAVIRLEENYRSTPDILQVANSVIEANASRRGKTLRATRPPGERVTVTGALDERDEADWLVQEIAEVRRRDGDLALRDFAVLYRTNSQSRVLEDSMLRNRLPYRLVGSVRFYDRREIRDLMAYLKLVANPADEEAFRRAIAVPRRGVGDTSVEQLASLAREAGVALLAAVERRDVIDALRPAVRAPLTAFAALIARLRASAAESGVDELLHDLIESIRYDDHLRAEGPDSADRVDNVRELVAGAAEVVVDEGGEVGLTPLDHFLQRSALVADVDSLDPDADAITMMTLHNAKGLEFPVVFITGLEDGLFPLSRAFDNPAMLEEERRLLYVGITRAEARLYLSHARSRRRNGAMMPSIPSSFLAPIPGELLDARPTLRLRATGRGAGGVLPRTPSSRRPGQPVTGWSRWGGAGRPGRDADADASQDAPLFVKGERVRHARFGSGTITDFSGAGKDTKVSVDFDDESIGRKRLVVAYAGLERGFE